MGGSHALNAGIWVRGDRWDYDTWAGDFGCEGWSWDDVLPVFREIETFDDGASETRGGDGLLDVVAHFPRNPLMEDLVEACRQTRIPLNPDYNSGTVDGVSRMQLTIRDGRRFNTWRAYLKPVADHPDLTIRTDLQVRRILFDGRRAVGVQVSDAHGVRELTADRIVLAAGALNSPELLLRSGVGPAGELREVGVESVHDLPGVGRNLHDHLLSPVVFTTDDAPVPEGEVTVAEVHFFDRSDPGLPVPDTQPIFFSVPMYAQDARPPQEPVAENGFTLQGGLVRPHSRGQVRLTGPEPSDPISVDLGALQDRRDVDALVASVRQCRQIGRAEALAPWGPRELYPGPQVSDAQLEDYVRGSVVTYHHQVGTCRMGRDEHSVVDPTTFAVHGVDDLFVADASIMPQVPTGNTNAPSVMIGERAATTLRR